jgi:hypothetical protein
VFIRSIRSVGSTRRRGGYDGLGDKNDGAGTLPAMYFRDMEGHVEAAALGKASNTASYSTSLDPFDGKRTWDGTNLDDDVHAGTAIDGLSRMFKEAQLPPRSRVYGVSRFDSQMYHERRRRETKEMKEDVAAVDGGDNNDADDSGGFGGNGGDIGSYPPSNCVER